MAHLGVADLTDLAHAAYSRELRDVVRLRGGSKKGVYRLTLDDGTTGVAYVWRSSEDYWPSHGPDLLFGHASGRDLFLTAHTALSEAGASVPRLVLVDSDVIVVEDLGGEFLEKLLDETGCGTTWAPCTSASARATAGRVRSSPTTRRRCRTWCCSAPSTTSTPVANGCRASPPNATASQPSCANGIR